MKKPTARKKFKIRLVFIDLLGGNLDVPAAQGQKQVQRKKTNSKLNRSV